MSNFHILTLGCPKNMVDTEDLSSLLTTEGLSYVRDPEAADVILINTCGFIEEAKKESIEEILGILEKKINGRKIAVFGCLAQRYMAELKKELPEVDAFFGVDSHDDILNFCKAVTPTAKIRNLEVHPPVSSLTKEGIKGGGYAYLKIADGCDRICSFCVIPKIRGRFRSAAPDVILQRAEKLINSGTKELLLVAQDITSYGREFKGYGLCELIRDITSLPGDFRVRLLYLYPTAIDEELLELISEDKKVCKYLDIPLQHSEDRILGLMKRGGSRKAYVRLINKIREGIPEITIRTSFIVGFPSETDEEFRALLDFVGEMEIERLGAFVYSREEGTSAFSLKGQIPKKIKEQRYHELMTQQVGISHRKNLSMVDRVVRILVDSMEGGIALGRYEGQAPEIDGMVIVKIPPAPPLLKGGRRGDLVMDNHSGYFKAGDFMNVRITDAYDYDLRSEPL